MSTCAQSLFGRDLGSSMGSGMGSGITRYYLLPVAGWEILLAKDVAFLAILFVLLLPLDPWPGMTFGVVALAAMGCVASVYFYGRRWERG